MRFLPFVLIVFLATACGSKKNTNTETGGDGLTLSTADRVMRSMIESQLNANWMDARASIKVSSPEMNVGGTAYIRLERDKRMWVSVKKFGFEAARALITPDSFFVLNRLQNEYTAEPLSYLETTYKVPARFDLLQQIILGNPIFFSRDLEVENGDGQYHLYGQDSHWKSDYWLGQENYFLERMQLREIGQNRKLQVFMDDFKTTNTGRPFSHGRELEIQSPSTGLTRVEMDFNRVKFNEEVSMPFEVPDRFKRGR